VNPTPEPVTTAGFPVHPPVRISRPVMVQRWDNLSFVHWAYDPEAVQRLLPRALRVDTLDDEAWVGLIPFRLTVRVRGTPSVPGISTCSEINLRTYVRGPDGRPGIWFFSLDASNLPTVALARGWYYLPYMWARIRTEVRANSVRYRGRRRWPSPHRPAFDLGLEVESPVPPADMTSLERFLVCRWRLYSPVPTGVAVTEVEHPPWSLHRATISTLRQDLLEAGGLPDPTGPPLGHFSPGVRTRFGPRNPL
jgi:uncharacterized protein